jgi:competence protein ComEA
MKEPLRDRLSSLSRGELIGLIAIIAVTVGGAGVWYLRSLPQPVQIRTAARPSAVQIAPSPSPVTIIVDVAGWVKKPGVYEFNDGDRIVDAVNEAGGARKGALLSGLNLAQPLTDGQQILVPEPIKKSEADAAASTTTGSTGTTAALPQVNINSADLTALETLNGIGEVIGQAIIDYREKNGPFKTIDEIQNVSGIGPVTFASIKNDITV